MGSVAHFCACGHEHLVNARTKEIGPCPVCGATCKRFKRRGKRPPIEVGLLAEGDVILKRSDLEAINESARAIVRHAAALGLSIDRHLTPQKRLRAGPEPASPAAAPATELQAIERMVMVPKNGATVVGKGGLYRILVALAMHPGGLTTRQIGIYAMLSTTGGTFSTYISRGSTAGWITEGFDGFASRTVTQDGLKALGAYAPLETGRALLYKYLATMGQSGQARILQAVAHAYPRALAHEEIGEAAGIETSGGTYSTYVSRLRSAHLIVDVVEHGKKKIRMSEELS